MEAECSHWVEQKKPLDIKVMFNLYKFSPQRIRTLSAGYGLAMMVEVLCGILGGSTYSTNIRKWGATGEAANLVSQYEHLP